MVGVGNEKIRLHIIISTSSSAPFAHPLAAACARSGLDFSVFVTGDGVDCLSAAGLAKALNFAGTAVVCRESWIAQMGRADCPLPLGSQTNNSASIANANRVLGL